MDRLQKVIRLHRLLRTGTCAGLSRILDELECKPPTFYRIRSFMAQQLHAPIIYDASRRGYRYAEREGERFELPGFWLSREELEAVLCFQNAVERLQAGYFSHALAPMRARVETLLRERRLRVNALHDRIRIIPLASRGVDDTIFRTVADAVISSRRLLIQHTPIEDKPPTLREVSPQSLIRYRDNWYLDAFCHLRNDLRSFSVDRITRAQPVKTPFRKIPREKLQAFFSGAYGIYNGPATRIAKILFTDTAARQVAREEWHPGQSGKTLPDGSYELTIPYNHSQELIMDVLRWGNQAHIIDPPELREEIQSRLRSALKLYDR